jgi:hypothetical protein
MAFPSVASHAQADSGISAVSSFACTMPSGISAGDRLIAIIGVDQARTVSIDTGASGSNWTIQQQASPANPDNLVTGAIITKIAEGSDALTITVDTADIINSFVLRVTSAGNVYVSTPATAGFVANADPPSLNPGTGTQDFLWIVAVVHDAQVVATAAPTNFSGLVTDTANSSGGCSISWATQNLAAASLDPGAFTSAAEQHVAYTIAVAPAASGLTITSVNTTNTAFSAQTDSAVIGTGLSASVVCTYAGIACTNESASSSTSLKITFPNFFTNNIKLGRNYEFKVVG